MFARLLAELYRALAVIANNTKKLTKTEAKAEAKLEDIEDIEAVSYTHLDVYKRQQLADVFLNMELLGISIDEVIERYNKLKNSSS